MFATCPECSKKLKLPDSAAGKKIRCPGCSGVVPVPGGEIAAGRAVKKRKKATGSAPPAKRRPTKKKKRPTRERADSNPFADDDFGAYDDFADPYGSDDGSDNPYASPTRSGGGKKRGGGRRRAGLETVGTGLLVQAWAVTAIVIMATLVFLTAATGVRALAGLMALGFGLVALISLIAILIGELLCLTAPSESGAKGMVIGAVACQVVGFFLNIAINMNPGNFPLSVTASLLSTGSVVLWLLFLKTIASYAGQSQLATRATILLFACIAWWIMSVVITILFLNDPRFFFGLGWGLFIVACIVGILFLVFCVAYVALLFRLGTALRR